jgi:hypothetical protein
MAPIIDEELQLKGLPVPPKTPAPVAQAAPAAPVAPKD